MRWLGRHRPAAGPRVTVHGDFRLGNFLVGPEGLRGVLDWELAHAGDPAEDIGWLCAPAWRFGGGAEVGGFGSLDELLDAYRSAGGERMDRDRVHWWQVYATVKWAIICALQASAHLSGATRSVELAAIGRRVCESEWDLFALLGVGPGDPAPEPTARGVVAAPFGRPTAAELVEAVREYLETLMEHGEGGARFEARVARNALAIVERELLLGRDVAAAHAYRLRDLGLGRRRRAGGGDPGRGLRRRLGAGGRRARRVGAATSCWWRTPPTCPRPASRPRRRGRRSAPRPAARHRPSR